MFRLVPEHFQEHPMRILSIPDDAASLADHFGALEDPRVDRTKKHELLDIIVLSLSGFICGADGWIAVEQYLTCLKSVAVLIYLIDDNQKINLKL